MCGIFGQYARSGEPLDVERLCRLTNLLEHRGPDGGAYWTGERFFLGHRRLAIIDLAAGTQPMASADGRLVISFNGEIYNYVELRDELRALGHVFATASDTEVLLAGYRQWGVDVLPRLTGMFAFGLVDRDERSLLIARDRFGEKPLLVCEHDGRVSFASELSPLAALLGGAAAIDDEALADYLCLNYVPGDRTLLRSVERLPPGSWRRYTPGQVTRGVYWTPAAETAPPPATLAAATDALAAHLDESVRLALRSDVPVALFLSGGLDSSLVAESATRQGTLKEAFCLDFEEASFSEWDNAAWVADRLGLQLHRVTMRADVLDDFADIVAHADDPLADASAVAVWALSREAAKHFKVVISGDGGDELFGGYLTYRATALHRAVIARLPLPLRRLLARSGGLLPIGDGKVSTGYKLLRFLRAADLPSSEAHFTWNGAWMPASAARLLSSPAARALAAAVTRRLADRHRLPARPDLGSLQRADAADYLANDILVKVDRMTMAHGLESRAPLLNQDLAGFAFGVTPGLDRGMLGQPKPLMRALAQRLFGPRVSAAKKQGFSIPIHHWLRGRGRDLVADLLSPASVAAAGVLDPAEVARVRDRLLVGKEPLGFEIWGLLVLVAWIRARLSPTRQSDLPQPALERLDFPRENRSVG